MNHISVLLFKDFETLDVFGPVEIFGVLKDLYRISFYSEKGGIINNSHGVAIETLPCEKMEGDPCAYSRLPSQDCRMPQ